MPCGKQTVMGPRRQIISLEWIVISSRLVFIKVHLTILVIPFGENQRPYWPNLSTDVPPPPPSNNVELAFYVMGDTPYNPKEEETLKRQLNIMTNNLHPRASFLVHVGDMQKSYRTQCSRDRFEHVREMLRKSPLSTFVLCGDNDYLDCKESEKA